MTCPDGTFMDESGHALKDCKPWTTCSLQRNEAEKKRPTADHKVDRTCYNVTRGLVKLYVRVTSTAAHQQRVEEALLELLTGPSSNLTARLKGLRDPKYGNAAVVFVDPSPAVNPFRTRYAHVNLDLFLATSSPGVTSLEHATVRKAVQSVVAAAEHFSDVRVMAPQAFLRFSVQITVVDTYKTDALKENLLARIKEGIESAAFSTALRASSPAKAVKNANFSTPVVNATEFIPFAGQSAAPALGPPA